MNTVIDVFRVARADNLCLEGCASALSQAETVNSVKAPGLTDSVVMGGAVVGVAVARVCDSCKAENNTHKQILILLP